MIEKINSIQHTQKFFKFLKPLIIILISAIGQYNSLVLCQSEPIELWSGIDADVPVMYELSIRATKEIRSNLTEQFIKTDINDIGLSYRVLPWWRVSSYYRWKIREKANIGGFYFATNISHSIDNFDLKYRLRYDTKGLDKDAENDQLRQKLSISYNFTKKFSISIEADLFYNFNIQKFNTIRYILIADITTMKRQGIELYLMRENEFNIDNPQSKFVLGISYQIKTMKLFP